jgi:pimeloyl-ACP methyl ester carboxylesterase
MIFSTMAEVAGSSKGEEPSELHRQMNLPFSNEEYLFRYAKNYMAYRDFDALEIASEIPQTTFVVAGQLDQHTNIENAQAIADHIPRSTIFIDEEGDHYAFCQAGSLTLEAIGRYFDV